MDEDINDMNELLIVSDLDEYLICCYPKD